MYCPVCGFPTIEKFPNNRAVADFYCLNCKTEFEQKSKNGAFGLIPQILAIAWKKWLTTFLICESVELRLRRSTPFDKKEIAKRNENYDKKPDNFLDYSDMNMIYLAFLVCFNAEAEV